jgi:hypothetical protein
MIAPTADTKPLMGGRILSILIDRRQMPDIAKITMPGPVQNVLESVDPSKPEKAEILVHEAEPLYGEIRVPNTLHDDQGNKLKLKKGADVEVHIEADKDATTPKKA